VGRHLAHFLEGAAVLITRGSAGMSLFRGGQTPWHVASLARNVYDVTGAGDTVIATLAAALVGGSTLEQAVQLASQCAAIVVEKLGTATVSAAELQRQLQLQ
jgi:D-beta-D-heptose 7-phosphate kinase/D-beta-D-heptose 1-phosphate adenosyltransferase